jgi:hypothetical protein
VAGVKINLVVAMSNRNRCVRSGGIDTVLVVEEVLGMVRGFLRKVKCGREIFSLFL